MTDFELWRCRASTLSLCTANKNSALVEGKTTLMQRCKIMMPYLIVVAI